MNSDPHSSATGPNGTTAASDPSVGRGVPLRKTVLLAGIAVVGFAGLTAALLLRFIIGGSLTLDAGDVALRDILAPQRTQYVSEFETKRQQDLAEASVAPIFTPLDAQVARQQIAATRGVLDQIVLIRQKEGDAAGHVADLTQLKPLDLDDTTAQLILSFPDARWARIDNQVISVLDSAMRAPIRPDNLDQAKRSLRQQISLSLSKDEAEMVERIAAALLVPNTNFDEAATTAAREAARANVKPVERVFEANQTIVRSGQIVGPADIEAMDKMNIRRPAMTWFDALSAMLLSGVCVLLMALTVVRRNETLLSVPLRNVALSAVTLTGTVFLARWLLPGHGLLPYIAPMALAGIVMTAWSGTLAGTLGSIIVGVLVGLSMDKPVEFTVVYSLGGILASLVLGRGTRVSDFIRAGVSAGLLQCVLVLAFNITQLQGPEDLPQLVSYLIGSLTAGVISSALALGGLYISSLLFDITTVVQLMDLARPSHPLIQKLLLQAPGTYHHSLMVGNLAEQAAERIGADSLLVRVGAYYHDIGKLENPHHFIENQMEGVNIHDRLDPRTSSALLHAHVTNGLALARKHHLPARIRSFISEHHGTMRTTYQYMRASKEAGGPVDDAGFRYPGPRPQTRETALLMLADASEATVRACKCETIEEMDAVIRRAITDRLADHQLDESNLTLRDIDLIRRSFLDTLRGVYHPRVEYPNNNPQPLALGDGTGGEERLTPPAKAVTSDKPGVAANA